LPVTKSKRAKRAKRPSKADIEARKLLSTTTQLPLSEHLKEQKILNNFFIFFWNFLLNNCFGKIMSAEMYLLLGFSHNKL